MPVLENYLVCGSYEPQTRIMKETNSTPLVLSSIIIPYYPIDYTFQECGYTQKSPPFSHLPLFSRLSINQNHKDRLLPQY